MKAIMRRQLGLENNELVIGGVDSDVVGVDLASLFPEIDNDEQGTLVTKQSQEIEIVCEDMEVVQDMVDVMENAGPGGVSPEALAVAQETIEAIFARHGVQPRGFAREAMISGQAVATREAVTYAKEGMMQISKEGVIDAVKNTMDRMKLNLQHAFKRRTAWRAEAIRIQKALNKATGTPKSGAAYNNRIRIAHMTLGDQTVLTDANQLHESILKTQESITGIVGFLTGLTTLFAWFSNEKGKVDFDKIAANFEPSKFSRDMLSVSGVQAIFGEETTMSHFGGVSNNPEEMMAIMRNVEIEHNHVWKVKDLDIDPLLPLTIDEMKKSIGALVKIGDEILDLYNRRDRELAPFLREQYQRQQTDGLNIDMIVSPVRYFRFINIYNRLLNQMLVASETTIDLNFQAATCVADYYRWSLENNK